MATALIGLTSAAVVSATGALAARRRRVIRLTLLLAIALVATARAISQPVG